MKSRPRKPNDWGGRGENSRTAKLTEEKVREIKRLLNAGVPQKEIAERFGVSPSTITHIHIGQSWRHVRV